MPFAVRRAREGAASLAALALVTAIAAASVGLITAFADSAFDDGVDGMLNQADPRDRTLVVDIPLGADDDTRTAMTAALDDTLAGQPVTVEQSVRATASALFDDGAETPLALLADPGAPDRAGLIDGDWPAGAGEAALAEPAAERLAATTGDVLDIDGQDVRVTGVWRAMDAADPAWSGNPSVASGAVGRAIGPVLVTDVRGVERATTLRGRWTIIPGDLTVASATELHDALGAATAAADTTAGGSADVEGGLRATLARTLAAVAGARVALTVPLVALLVIAAVIVGVVTFTLGRQREQEHALLVARGAARTRLWGAATAEVAVAAVAGAVVGGAVAVFLAAPIAIAVATACAAGAIAVGAAVAASALARAGGQRTERARPATVTLLLVLFALAIAAGLAVAQAFARGGLVDGTGRVDPLAVAAPWLVLVALCLLVTMLAGPAATAAEWLTRRGRALSTRLGVLQLARRPHSVIAGVLCLALAAAGIALAAHVTGGSADRTQAAASAVGADVRAELDVQAIIDERNPALPIEALRGRPGIDAADPAITTPATVGKAPARLIATTPSGFAAASGDTAAALESLPAGEPAPLSGDELTVEVTAVYISNPQATGDGSQAAATISAWAIDDDGMPRRLEFGTVPIDGQPHTLTVPSQGATGLLFVDVLGRGLDGGSSQVELVMTDAAGAVDMDDPRTPLTGTRALRYSGVVGFPAEIPVVVTSAFADRVHAPVGGVLNVRITGTTRDVAVRVAAVVDALPGVGSRAGLALDLAALTTALADERSAVLAPGTVLVTTDDRAAAEDSVRAWATAPVRVLAADGAGAAPISRPTLALFWVAAAVAAALGALGFGIVFAATARARRDEVVPLLSFGFDVGAQRRSRAAEILAAAVFAVVAGALAGWATGALIAPVLLGSLTGVTV